ncbi:ABC transporter ATP-binding protein [Sphingobacterium yanglingense]|uniref:ABC-type Fe3+/spermidine/putrescine transport system ATPase subunit n=1 Tax=Sphingobacterium yanglingense TaxID=1437280 RepID=A0A4R6WD56_9SPHI|nr:ABC transporter ATP-binding protein [Sphingobacterium yanglingense]TDQ75888.1 ABC-type Fe3+/spermidine/putrescine transport system ATPase subunit [Sphingobacterium yanglingense]
MAHSKSSCQYIPSDTQKTDVSLIYGRDISSVFESKERVVAVDHVDFDIEQGKITAIIGESGSGKSTLLKLIYGLLEPFSGEVRYKGWLVPTRKDKLIPGHDAMKLVSQGFEDLNLYAKVWDNIASQLPNTNLDYKKSRTEEMLVRLKINHLAQQRVADLSGGERQRVAIARALINDPKVLLMDEPFNQVDAAFRDDLQQDIRQIVEELGLTVILVSHDPAEVLAMADSLIVMKAGKIVDLGSPETLYYTPQNPYTALLLAKSNILTPEQADTIGLKTTQSIAVHQEWIEVTASSDSTLRIKNIRFRGFYKEYVIGDDNLSVHAIVNTASPLPTGTKVKLDIKKHITFTSTNL